MTAPTYASTTTVTVAKSQSELRALLTKYGVTHFGIAEQPGMAALAFQLGGENHRVTLPIRDAAHRDFGHSPAGRSRDGKQRKAAAVQEERARWRSLVLVVKAKLEYAAILGQPAATAFSEYRVLQSGLTVQEAVTGQAGPPVLTWGS